MAASPDEKTTSLFVELLGKELVCALGCTEPIALAYGAALAGRTLGEPVEHMVVRCSGNIIKNVKSVVVPNSGGLKGVEVAAVADATQHAQHVRDHGDVERVLGEVLGARAAHEGPAVDVAHAGDHGEEGGPARGDATARVRCADYGAGIGH